MTCDTKKRENLIFALRIKGGIMEELRRFLSFNKGERMAIVTILVLILLLILACVLHRPHVSFDQSALHNLDSMLALRQAALDEQRNRTAMSDPAQLTMELSPFPFNPNTMTEEDGRKMGLTDRQIRNVINYRDKGGKFYSKKDFGKLYSISESDYAQLEPYIILPEVTRKRSKQNSVVYNSDKEKADTAPKVILPVELNTVDSATMVELPQIGPYLAMRILDFREKLGGYVHKSQLLAVKGMDSARFVGIEPYFMIAGIEPRKMNVNHADFKTLLYHPYLNYEQVKIIVNHREKRGMIKNWGQLVSLLKDENELDPLLELYLEF